LILGNIQSEDEDDRPEWEKWYYSYQPEEWKERVAASSFKNAYAVFASPASTASPFQYAAAKGAAFPFDDEQGKAVTTGQLFRLNNFLVNERLEYCRLDHSIKGAKTDRPPLVPLGPPYEKEIKTRRLIIPRDHLHSLSLDQRKSRHPPMPPNTFFLDALVAAANCKSAATEEPFVGAALPQSRIRRSRDGGQSMHIDTYIA